MSFDDRAKRAPVSYFVVFEWPVAARIPARTAYLDATHPEEARVEAALMFGCEPFEHGLPARYMVFDASGGLIFTYPEQA